MRQHDASINGFLKYMLAAPIVGILLMLTVAGAKHSYYTLIPTSWVYEYKRIEMVNDPIQWGPQKIQVASYNEWKMDDIYVEWNDEIHCKMLRGGWIKVNNQPWKTIMYKQDNTKVPAIWIFSADLPARTTQCKLVSHIRTNVGGVDKEPRTYESAEFSIVRREKKTNGS